MDNKIKAGKNRRKKLKKTGKNTSKKAGNKEV